MADRECPTCGAELRIISEFEPPTAEERARSAGPQGGTVRLGAICSNPDCPTVESDLAKPANRD